jgi:hypothetical protein
MRLSCFVGVLLLVSAGCGGFTQKFEESFDKSFRESCRAAAIKSGATPAVAEPYCECALTQYKETKSMDKARSTCVAQIKSNPPPATPAR